MKSIRKKNNLYKHFLNEIQTRALNLNISNIEISLIIPSVLPSVYILRAKLNNIRMISKALGRC